MTDPDHDIEQALASLRPRAPGPAVAARLARELDAAPEARRGVVIAWSAGLAAVAAALVAAFVFLGGVVAPEASTRSHSGATSSAMPRHTVPVSGCSTTPSRGRPSTTRPTCTT